MIELLLVVGLMSCSSGLSESEAAQIKQALVGSWGTVTEDGVKNSSVGWTFYEDGTASSFAFGAGNSGTYEIQRDKIVLTYHSGGEAVFLYSFENGALQMKGDSAGWWNMYRQ